MNQNPLEGNQQEIYKNPEVATFCTSLVHHLGHFIMLSRMKGAYDAFSHLTKAKEFIVKLLNISKNPLLIACLKQLQEKLNGINEEEKFDTALIDVINKIYDPIFNYTIEQY